ncbi:MAG: hypothetical protein WCK67_01335 [bacterium]
MLNIYNISPNVVAIKNIKKTSFGADVGGDVGTSRKPANIGMTVNGEAVIQKGTPLFGENPVTPAGMLKSLALYTSKALTGHESERNNIAIALPGPVKNGFCYPPNIKNPETNIAIGAIPIDKKTFCSQPELKGINFNNVIFCNDGASWGGLVLLRLAADKKDLNELFPDGKETPVITPGGGLAVTEIRGRKDTIEIVPREKGHLFKRGTDRPIEQVSTSVPAMIKNYATALGINSEKAEALGKIGDGKIVTEHEISLNPQKATYKKLKDANLLNLFTEKVDGDNVKLTLNDNNGNPIKENQHETAFNKAANQFYEGIGQVIADFVDGGKTDKAVLTGAFVGFVMKKSKDLGQNPEQLIKAHMMENLDLTGQNLVGSSDKFQILHVAAMDSTEGGELIAKSSVGGDSDYYSIKREELS